MITEDADVGIPDAVPIAVKIFVPGIGDLIAIAVIRVAALIMVDLGVVMWVMIADGSTAGTIGL
jgi:hypothetical protein